MKKKAPNPRDEALMELIEAAGGYFVAKPEQIMTIATKHGLEAWDLEGMYWDAGERAANE